MERPTCQRCGIHARELTRVFIGQAEPNGPASPLPLRILSFTGGTLEICGNCHEQWLAAIKTWFELTETHVRVISYWWEAGSQFWLFTVFDKDEMSDLTATERKVLKEMIKREPEARRKR